MHFTRFSNSEWPIRALFPGIWTTFDAYIIPYHDEDIAGFILRYGVQIHQGCIKTYVDPSKPIASEASTQSQQISHDM